MNVPSPICPYQFQPQHLTLPPANRAQVWLKPRANSTNEGTLVMVGQPSEEIGNGAKAMLADGLFTRFPRPDFAVGIHDTNEVAAGSMAWVSGYALANVDSLDLTVFGKGGHGAYPHKTIDPIVIAARIVVALQTVVSRENDPTEPAVVTVGSIHGGATYNVIPDEVKLQLTVRTYDADVRTKVLAAIERIAKGIAQAAGVPKEREPIVDLHPENYLPATYSNPGLVRRIVPVFRSVLGAENVREMEPVGGAEDFALYSLEDRSVPIFQFWLGAVDPKKVAEARSTWCEPEFSKTPIPFLCGIQAIPTTPVCVLRWQTLRAVFVFMEQRPMRRPIRKWGARHWMHCCCSTTPLN